jgi:hypothetical protein
LSARVIFWLLLLTGFALRMAGLGSDGLWWDEAWQYYVVSAETFRGFWDRLLNPKITLNPPLYHLVSYGSVRLLAPIAGGLSDAVLRAPSAILGTLGLPLVYALVRRLRPDRADRPLALCVMAIVTFAPFHVHYSQEARMYTLVMALAVASTLALAHALTRGGRAAWALYALTAAAAMYTHVHTLFGLVGHAIWILGAHRRRLAPFIGSALVAALLFLPMVHFFLERVGNLRSPYGGAGASLFSVPYSLFVYSIGLSLGPSVAELKMDRSLGSLAGDWPIIAAVGIVFGALCLTGVAAAPRGGPVGRWGLLTGFLTPLVGVSVAAALPNMTFNVRYTAWAFPFFCVLLGLGLRASWRRSRALGVVAALAVAIAFAVSNVERHVNPRYGKEDVRGAVAAWRGAGGATLLFSYNGSPTVERYLAPAEEMWHVPIYGRRAAPRRLRSVLAEVAADTSEVADRSAVADSSTTPSTTAVADPSTAANAAPADSVHVLLARDWTGVVERDVRETFPVLTARRFPGAVSLLTLAVPVRVAHPPLADPAPPPRGEE